MTRLCKYSGAGNTFVIVEEQPSAIQIKALCKRHATDGLIYLNNFTMHYYNADGSEAEMCGNGLRCVIQYLFDKGIVQDLYTIKTKAGLQRGKIVEGRVLTYLQPPTVVRWNQQLELGQQSYDFDFINSGVPHALFFFTPKNVPLLGAKICHHPHFAPEGTNVNFITMGQGQEITLRTYERGVGCETLACGTGAVATALAATKRYKIKPPIKVQVLSNEILTVNFTLNQNQFTNITLLGPAKKIA